MRNADGATVAFTGATNTIAVDTNGATRGGTATLNGGASSGDKITVGVNNGVINAGSGGGNTCVITTNNTAGTTNC
ncbi:hypothetical protein CU254_19305 [Amycolatopsis sp. AA4]|uniref:hypothetical protein n=1 Tax=Actinomycetes TaxID=1760 RepID=UPI0001B58072|nr:MULTISPECIES: hypothetical protein [Actinomycetes]ATY12370.1 hypothetical protein CU254_19305 [Amycolatopsis sp. AA4]